MDAFLRKVIENRDREADLRGTLEVLQGKILCEVCHSVLNPGLTDKLGRVETDKRCLDCIDIKEWTPQPSPLSLVPPDIELRPTVFHCHNCGDVVNAHECGTTVFKFCSTKPECAKAMKNWRSGFMRQRRRAHAERIKAREDAERGMQSVEPTPFKPAQKCSTEGCNTTLRQGKRTGVIADKCFKCRGGSAAWRAQQAVVDKLIAERVQAVETERMRKETAASKLPDASSLEGDAKEVIDQECPGGLRDCVCAPELTGEKTMTETAAVVEVKTPTMTADGLRNFDGWVPLTDIGRVEARTGTIVRKTVKRLHLSTEQVITAKRPHAEATCISQGDVDQLRKALSEIERRRSRHGSPEERLAKVNGHEAKAPKVAKAQRPRFAGWGKPRVAKAHHPEALKVKAKPRSRPKQRRAAPVTAVPPVTYFEHFKRGLTTKVITQAEKLEKEAQALQAKAVNLRAAAKLLAKT